MKKPLCRCGCEKPALKGRFFATQKCAAEWVEELLRGDELRWCPTCKEWVNDDFEDRLSCGHMGDKDYPRMT